MLKQEKKSVRVCATCRGEGTGYVALCSKTPLRALRVEVRATNGQMVPSELFCVEISSERSLLVSPGEYAWIAVFPLLNLACTISFYERDQKVLDYSFTPKASKVLSRLLTRQKPRIAALLRGYEQRRSAGRARLFVREAWPTDDGMVSWRLQAEFPTGNAFCDPRFEVFDADGRLVDVRIIIMEDHVVPSMRDEAISQRQVSVSCIMDEAVGSFFVTTQLASDEPLTAFACMNEPRARGMLADARHRMDGAPANGWYEEWFANQKATEAEVAHQKRIYNELADESRPLVSIVVPVFRPQREFLEAAVDSVLRQSYGNWELLVVNASGDCPEVDGVLRSRADKRIKVLSVPNRSIAANTNEGIAAAAGAYVAFLDHDDVLEPDALWRYVQTVLQDPCVDLLYCDEDHMRDGHVHAPAFKTFPNYGKLYTHNYVTHFLMVSRYVLEHTDRTGDDVSGAQDYDLTLKAFEVARKVVHVPRVLYHWREHEGSTSGGGDQKPYAHEAGKRALEAHLDRRGIAATVEDGPLVYTYRVRYELPEPKPLVSIVIPTRDHADLLRTCVESILERSTYECYEVVLVENGSTNADTFALYDELVARGKRVRVVRWEPREGEGFNYSALVNFGVAHSAGELVVLLNNDTEVIEPSWLEEMAGCLMRPEVGVVGAKLLFYDGLIQHVGMVANPAGDNCHVCQNLTRTALGAGYAAMMPGDYSMVTGACQMTRRSVFDELDGYDEGLAVGFNDGDFCLRAREAGYSVAMAPYALLYHREFSTRGREITDTRLRTRFLKERARIMGKHPEFYAQGDPALNPNLNGFSAYFDL